MDCGHRPRLDRPAETAEGGGRGHVHRLERRLRALRIIAARSSPPSAGATLQTTMPASLQVAAASRSERARLRSASARRRQRRTAPSKALDVFANPNPGRDYLIQFQVPEFTCLCPLTGQPDFALFTIDYVPDELCVELKSLKMYMWSFRDEGAFHEEVTNRILDDIVAATRPRFMRITARWGVRGGIFTNVVVEHRKPGWTPRRRSSLPSFDRESHRPLTTPMPACDIHEAATPPSSNAPGRRAATLSPNEPPAEVARRPSTRRSTGSTSATLRVAEKIDGTVDHASVAQEGRAAVVQALRQRADACRRARVLRQGPHEVLEPVGGRDAGDRRARRSAGRGPPRRVHRKERGADAVLCQHRRARRRRHDGRHVGDRRLVRADRPQRAPVGRRRHRRRARAASGQSDDHRGQLLHRRAFRGRRRRDRRGELGAVDGRVPVAVDEDLRPALRDVGYGRVPAGSVVVPGTLPSTDGSHGLYCAVIVKQVTAETRAKTSINELLRGD